MPSYRHEWVCIKCGKTYKTQNSIQNPPTPNLPGKCPGTPTGKHVVIKQQ